MTSIALRAALLCTSCLLAQQPPTAQVGFSGGPFFVSEIDRTAVLSFYYGVTSPPVPGTRRHTGPSDLVKLNIVGGSASNKVDFWDVPEFVFFNGDFGSHVKTITFTVSMGEVEENEMIEFELAAGWGVTSLWPTRATLVIVDSSVGKVRFAETNMMASEAAGVVEGTLVRDYGTRGEIEVMVQPWYGGVEGWANADSDAGEMVAVKFADGQDRASFRLKLTQDSLVEGHEKLLVRLVDKVQRAYVSKEELVVTIADDSVEIAREENGVRILWADPCEGCELQVSEEPMGGRSWTRVDAVAVRADGKWTISQPAEGATKFYRLKR